MNAQTRPDMGASLASLALAASASLALAGGCTGAMEGDRALAAMEGDRALAAMEGDRALAAMEEHRALPMAGEVGVGEGWKREGKGKMRDGGREEVEDVDALDYNYNLHGGRDPLAREHGLE